MNAHPASDASNQKDEADSAAIKQVLATGQFTEEALDALEQLARRPKTRRSNAPVENNLLVTAEPDLQRASALLDKEHSVHVVAFYEPAQQRLTSAIEAGDSLDSAVKACMDYADVILGMYRKSRHRVTLIDSTAAAAHPKAVLDIMEARIGLQSAPSPAALCTLEMPAPENMSALIAVCALQDNYDLKLLTREIEAGSSMLPDPASLSLSQQLLQQKQELDTKEQDSRNVETENELLLLQLHQIQDELEAYFNKSRELETSLDNARQSAASAGDELQTATRENLTLTGQLNEQRKHLEITSQALHETRQTVADLQRSLSWRVTAPLRWALGLFVSSKN